MTRRQGIIRTLAHALFFGLLWLALSEGSFYQIWIGGIVVAIATAISLILPESDRLPVVIRGSAITKFIPYFIYQSLKGGFFVGKLAVLPRNSVRSQYFDYKVKIPREAVSARMCFASCLCIFPGTLSCGYIEDILVIHALDAKSLDLKAIRDLEQMTAAIFGIGQD